jgi:hypothetical protein
MLTVSPAPAAEEEGDSDYPEAIRDDKEMKDKYDRYRPIHTTLYHLPLRQISGKIFLARVFLDKAEKMSKANKSDERPQALLILGIATQTLEEAEKLLKAPAVSDADRKSDLGKQLTNSLNADKARMNKIYAVLQVASGMQIADEKTKKRVEELEKQLYALEKAQVLEKVRIQLKEAEDSRRMKDLGLAQGDLILDLAQIKNQLTSLESEVRETRDDVEKLRQEIRPASTSVAVECAPPVQYCPPARICVLRRR